MLYWVNEKEDVSTIAFASFVDVCTIEKLALRFLVDVRLAQKIGVNEPQINKS